MNHIAAVIAFAALAGSAPTAAPVCVKLEVDDANYIMFAATPEALASLPSNLEKRRSCVMEGGWNLATAEALCEAFDKLDDASKASIENSYGLHPDKICEMGREAAVMSR